MEKIMEEDSVLTLAKELELSFWADAEERERYFAHQQLLLDAYSDAHTWEFLLEEKTEKALKDGLEQGLKQGLEQGWEQSKREIAQNLLEIGLDVDKIAQASGLSVEEIQRLQK
jgi:predicted transposase/invertase (TIGR01784 family)